MGVQVDSTSAIHGLQESLWREVLHNILVEFGMPMKPIRLIKMSLNEINSKARIGKHLSDKFLYQKRS
jgi:hypothetical protein